MVFKAGNICLFNFLGHWFTKENIKKGSKGDIEKSIFLSAKCKLELKMYHEDKYFWTSYHRILD